MRRFLAGIESRTTRFRQEEHTAHEQRYWGFAGGASTGFSPLTELLRAGAETRKVSLTDSDASMATAASHRRLEPSH